jgi:hypothetical protein
MGFDLGGRIGSIHSGVRSKGRETLAKEVCAYFNDLLPLLRYS